MSNNSGKDAALSNLFIDITNCPTAEDNATNNNT